MLGAALCACTAQTRLAGAARCARRAAQDPRALLHSRFRVGWGTPKTRKWVDVAKWAGKMCSTTLRDMRAGEAVRGGVGGGGGGRRGERNALYVRIKYEELAQHPLEEVRRVYSLIGRPVPPSVEGYFTALTLQMRGQTSASMERALALGAVKGIGNARRGLWEDVYATTTTKSVAALVRGWRSALSREAIDAVQSRPKCRVLMAELGYKLA